MLMFSPSGKAFYSVLNIFFANYVLNVLSSNFRELLSETHTILSGRTQYSFKCREDHHSLKIQPCHLRFLSLNSNI